MIATMPPLLAAFPPEVIRDVELALAGGAALVEADPALREFRRSPASSVAAVSSRLHDLWRVAPAPGRVVWFLTGSPDTGLDDFELAALLGRFMCIDSIWQAAAGGDKHIVAIGTLREEKIGVSVIAPPASSAGELVGWFSKLEQLAAALVFLDAPAATTLAADSSGTAAVRRYLQHGGAIGLFVPRDRTADALGDPEAELAPFDSLLERRPSIGRFEDLNTVDARALHDFMRRTGLRADASLAAVPGSPAEDAAIRRGPYTGSAPYVPQPFDLRVPLARAKATDWYELPHLPAVALNVEAWWASHVGPPDTELVRLLDAARMEAFFRLSRVSYADQRRYPEVRVYNWPAPAPASRATLFDCGSDSEQLAEMLARLSGLAAAAGNRLRLVAPSELLATAAVEVASRFDTSSQAAITLQHEAHDYLADVPQDAPLRGDYADFARFAPAALGHALELGSGYGHLAWVLAPRSQRYIRLDLDPRMFVTLRPDLGQSGVVADMHHLPFDAATFDTVLANNVLEHLYEPLAGLKEVHRVLRPGGKLVALVPFDALNNRHELPAHHWKIDEAGLRAALTMAGFETGRLEVVSLYDFGVSGAFPCQMGLVARFEANKTVADAPGSGMPTARLSYDYLSQATLPGRLMPVVCEYTGFERWSGREVLTVASDPSDVAELTRFGAKVTTIHPESRDWPVADASVDLVYAFLTLPRGPLSPIAAEVHRVLKPGGVVVAGFRHRDGLRYLAGVRSYFGQACGLADLAGPDDVVRLGDDAGARFDDEYVSAFDVEAGFAGFAQQTVRVGNLTPDDLPAVDLPDYEPAFWQWLSTKFGRFVLLRAVK